MIAGSLDFRVADINIKVEAVNTANRSGICCYLIGGEAEAFPLLDEPKPNLILINGFDWNRDLSPWKCGAAFGGEDFSGGGERFLSALLNTVIPKCEAAFEIAVEKRVMVGYSLAGLFSLWAAAKSDMFDRAASMSGSLWFDGFTDFLDKCELTHLERVYLSLGDRESSTKNLRMKAVGERTEECAAIFREHGVDTRFEYSSGGHFKNVPARIARGVNYICKP